MTEHQLEIPGVGQDKMTLSRWKREEGIYTHHAPWMAPDCPTWVCWSEMEDPGDFLATYGDDAFGNGNTEREAIEDYCLKSDIEKPFWW